MKKLLLRLADRFVDGLVARAATRIGEGFVLAGVPGIDLDVSLEGIAGLYHSHGWFVPALGKIPGPGEIAVAIAEGRDVLDELGTGDQDAVFWTLSNLMITKDEDFPSTYTISIVVGTIDRATPGRFEDIADIDDIADSD